MFKDLLAQLAVPFHSGLVEWKPQAISADKQRALAAAYVDMRDYEDRLDKVFPQWTSSAQFLLTGDKVAAVVSLTLDGVTRVNVGEAKLSDENAFTSAFAQAFKRVCSDFGLGRYLYRLPQEWCTYDEKRRAIINPPELPVWARHPDEIAVETQVTAPAKPADETLAENLCKLGFEPEPAEAETEQAEVAAAEPGSTVVHFGRYNGKSLAEIWALGKEGQGWVRWCASLDGKGFNTKNDTKNVHLQRMARTFLSLQSAYAG
ncbi:Rad52/Rad22 family DNA repair protein [Thermanaerothrix sp. 4228-RoL]|uniref:Rad52/Rad22 family DNA repair protein n=1 Tax=Thermanaerothrix solaris TaxID=3058434 RepID=A0ABU3NK00_9CHLR|nr:Rad52/Rad22 family DNA repair protein [Thermanaerothrix sp. 4228-RoL]MDT8896650.1 Rad52/Rad22 family DNA repair protein [Thermanaerothrix sp. 4228-RoL]